MVFLDLLILLVLGWLLTKSVSVSIVLSLLNCVFLLAFRVYEKDHLKNFKEQILRVFTAFIFSFFFEHLFYLIISRPLSLKYFIARIFLYTTVLSFLNYLVNRAHRIKPKRCIVIGRRNDIEQIVNEIRRKSDGEFRFVKYFDPSLVSIELIGRIGSEADTVVVTDYKLYRKISEKTGHSRRIVYFPEFVERTLKRIPIELIEKFKDYYETTFSQVRESTLKRIIDIVFSILGLVIFSPVMLLIAVLIIIEDGRPVIFRQYRVGRCNQLFLMYKFRTMKNGNLSHAKFADQERDRILKLGKAIRPFRLDECLQFFNILKGDMSLVGPRPEQESFVKDFEQKIPYYSYRHLLKPGLTGWAQIMYKYSSNLEETKMKLSYDLYYIKNRTLLMDLKIILQTIEAVIWRRGAK